MYLNLTYHHYHGTLIAFFSIYGWCRSSYTDVSATTWLVFNRHLQQSSLHFILLLTVLPLQKQQTAPQLSFWGTGGNESPSESSLQAFLCISQQFCWLLTLIFWPSLPFSWCFLCIYIYSGSISISISISISLPIIYLCVCLSPFNLLSQQLFAIKITV